MNSNGQIFLASDGFAGDVKRPQDAFSRLMNAGMPYGTFYITPMVGFFEFPKWKKVNLNSGFYIYGVTSKSGEALFAKPEKMPPPRTDIRRPLVQEMLTQVENRAVMLPEGQIFGALSMRPAKFGASRNGWEAAIAVGVICQPKQQIIYDGMMQDVLVDTENGEMSFFGTTEERHDSGVKVAGRKPADVLEDLIKAPIWGYGERAVPLPFISAS